MFCQCNENEVWLRRIAHARVSYMVAFKIRFWLLGLERWVRNVGNVEDLYQGRLPAKSTVLCQAMP